MAQPPPARPGHRGRAHRRCACRGVAHQVPWPPRRTAGHCPRAGGRSASFFCPGTRKPRADRASRSHARPQPGSASRARSPSRKRATATICEVACLGPSLAPAQDRQGPEAGRSPPDPSYLQPETSGPGGPARTTVQDILAAGGETIHRRFLTGRSAWSLRRGEGMLVVDVLQAPACIAGVAACAVSAERTAGRARVVRAEIGGTVSRVPHA
jgi:hypothetical protein